MKVAVENGEAKNKEEENIHDHTFTNVKEIIDFTNDNLGDTIYIGERNEEGIEKPFMPEKKDIGRCYWTDFLLKTRKEAKDILKIKEFECNLDNDADFFVYNERTNELVPFKKNDFMMFDHGDGYLTFDGISYIYYDDNGYEKSRNTYIHDTVSNVKDIPEIKHRKKIPVKPKPKKK